MLLAVLSHGPAVSVPYGEDAEQAASSTRRGADAAPPPSRHCGGDLVAQMVVEMWSGMAQAPATIPMGSPSG